MNLVHHLQLYIFGYTPALNTPHLLVESFAILMYPLSPQDVPHEFSAENCFRVHNIHTLQKLPSLL